MEQAGSMSDPEVGLVVIGRNEGERLRRCLDSVAEIPARVYVDSGSTDGSVALARARGVEVVELPVPPNFTAARARNAGLARLLERHPAVAFVQMVDGDSEVRPGWIAAAAAALDGDPGLAVAFGRNRERFPERSIYNAICDDEWDQPVGEATGAGGNAMIRVAALRQIGGYREGMIAAEDTEMSQRLRERGWRLACLAHEMTLHDADITRFGQWWQRTRRSGHAFAELAHLHPQARRPDWRRACRSILVWGGAFPVLLLLGLVAGAVGGGWWWLGPLALMLGWAARAMRYAGRQRARGLAPRIARASGWLIMLGKVPELLGLIRFHLNRRRGRASLLIEHKRAPA